MTNQNNRQKTVVVNGVSVQMSFASKTDEQTSQRVWELLKSIYARQMREVAAG